MRRCTGRVTVKTAEFYVKGLILEKIIFVTEVRRKNVEVNFFIFLAVKPVLALRSQLGAIRTLMVNVFVHILRQFWTGKRILAQSMGVGGLPPHATDLVTSNLTCFEIISSVWPRM